MQTKDKYHCPVQWVQGMKQQRSEAHRSPQSSAEVRNGGAIPPLHYVSCSLLGFWTLSIVGILIARNHNVSETGSVSVLR
jgi:hypothetical protein